MSNVALDELWCACVCFFLLDYFDAGFLRSERSLLRRWRWLFVNYRLSRYLDKIVGSRNNRRRSRTAQTQLPIVVFSVITIVMFGATDTIEREDLRRDSIQKVTVVTDRHYRSFVR